MSRYYCHITVVYNCDIVAIFEDIMYNNETLGLVLSDGVHAYCTVSYILYIFLYLLTLNISFLPSIHSTINLNIQNL